MLQKGNERHARSEQAGEAWRAVVAPARAGPVLRTPRGARYRLGVVSSKYRHRVEVALERDGLLVFVEVVVGSNDVPRPRPAPMGCCGGRSVGDRDR